MRIFLSYPSEHRDTAARLTKGLEAEQHDVFFDHDDLGAGEAFHQAIRDAVARADLMIYLVSPESVAPGSYTLAELAVAELRWPRPSGHVLPVMVAPTPLAELPAYLLAVTLLEPRGELVAETLMAVSRLQRKRRSRPWLWALAAAVGLAASVAAVLFMQARQKAATELALRSEQTQRASARSRP